MITPKLFIWEEKLNQQAQMSTPDPTVDQGITYGLMVKPGS
jgi:hypothetical protein